MNKPLLSHRRVVVTLVLVLATGLLITAVAAQGLDKSSNEARPAAGLAQATAAVTRTLPSKTPGVATNARRLPPLPSLAMDYTSEFTLDPFLVSLQGGGPMAASQFAANCPGYVAAAPSFSLNYKGTVDLARVFFVSDGDPTLLIQTPDGKYLCNDDATPQLLDPTLELNKPAPGLYKIWVGASNPQDLVPGLLVLTTKPGVHLGNFALANLIKRPTLPDVLPLRERLDARAALLEQAKGKAQNAKTLNTGQPLTLTVTAQGTLPAMELTQGITRCAGLINTLPDLAFNWSGQAKALSVLFEGDRDTAVLVRTPGGTFVCNDDADRDRNLNPDAVIANPDKGAYLVWVGRIDSITPAAGTLKVAASGDVKPAVLPKNK